MRWLAWIAGGHATRRRAPTSTRPTSWWTACAGGIGPGRGFASTCSTSRSRCVPIRSRSIPTKTSPTTGPASRIPARGAENLLELVRSRDLELIVAAVRGTLVGSPSFEHRRVAEPIALHVVVLHLAHTFHTQ